VVTSADNQIHIGLDSLVVWKCAFFLYCCLIYSIRIAFCGFWLVSYIRSRLRMPVDIDLKHVSRPVSHLHALLVQLSVEDDSSSTFPLVFHRLSPLHFPPSHFLLETLRPSPLSLDMILLINPWEEVLLQMPERPSRHRLIIIAAQRTIESLLRHSTIFELC
jgi:hypothetical protein